MNLRSGFTMGEWTVFPLEGRLIRPGEERRVQPKSMEVLLRLAEADGQVVERDDLLRAVWAERAVSDEPLTRCIGELRRALGDKRNDPDYILTIPKRGYRLLAAVGTPRSGAKARRRITPAVILAVLAIAVAAGLAGRWLWPDSTDTAVVPAIAERSDRSIVVLPFVDMSPGGDQEYLSDGISEELLNLLARIPGLRVISRTSAFSFKHANVDVRDIAARLDVAYVLEGSVRTSGRRIRITTQLIDASSDTHLWSATYDRELEDIFAIQDEIAAAVVDKLEMTLFSDAPQARTTDPEAYALFLQGRYLHEHTGGDSFQRAFDYYEAALDVDPAYVPAWVWLAALYDDTVNSAGLPRDEVGRRARDAIGKALAIDPDDALALGMSGILADAWDNDPGTAGARMQRALTIDPGNPVLLRWAAIVLNALGRHEEAARVAEYLVARDPIGSISRVNLAATYILAGRYADAVRVCRIDVELQSDAGPCLSRMIIAHLQLGDGDAARALLDRVEGSRVDTRLAPMTFHALGRSADYEAAMARLQAAYDSGDPGLAYWIGRTYAFTGEDGRAFEWLDRAVELGVADLSPRASYFRSLWNDPRWTALLEKAGRSEAVLDAVALEVALPAT